MAKSLNDLQQNFERIEYDNIQISNIFKHCKTFNGIGDGQKISLEYALNSNEDIMIIADKIFGKSFYSWIIYHINEILHPVYSFTLKDYTFKEWIIKEFDGQTIYIDPETDFRTVDISIGDDVYFNSEIIGTVKAFNPQLFAITILPNDRISDWSNVTDIQIGSDSFDVKRQLKEYFSLHYFEDDDGEILNPREVPASASESRIEGFIRGENDYTIRILDHQDRLNKAKAIIKILKPEKISDIREFINDRIK